MGVSITCHEMTQSKIIVQMLDCHGHGRSYDEAQWEDNLCANRQLDKNQIVIPSNINQGSH